MGRCRLLIAGDVLGQFDALWKRVKLLNESKAGPFDLVLVAGAFFADAGNDSAEAVLEQLKGAPLPTYFTDSRGAPAEVQLGGGLSGSTDSASASSSGESDTAADGSVAALPPPIHYLGPGGIAMIGTLTVAFWSPGASESKGMEALEQLCNKAVFLGADVLLTPEWPAGLSTMLPEHSGHIGALESLGVHINGVGHSSAAKAALLSRPRYHFGATEGVFFQRLPYRNFESPPTRKQSYITRFIGLGAIAAGGGKVDKARKWLHAVAVDPIPYMTLSALADEPAGTTDSPFALRSSQIEQAAQHPAQSVASAMPGVNAQAPMLPTTVYGQGVDGNGYFFGEGNGGARPKRRRRDHDDEDVDENNCTLFIGGFTASSTDSDALKSALTQAVPGLSAVLTHVRIPLGKPYAFLEFTNHQAAKEALYALDNMPLILGGTEATHLSVNWGKGRQQQQRQQGETNYLPHSIQSVGAAAFPRPPLPPGPPPAQNMLQARATREEEQLAFASDESNCTLFVGGIGMIASGGDGAGAEEVLQSALHSALPALKDTLVNVRVPVGKAFGFLEFTSHAAAAEALISLATLEHLNLPSPSPSASNGIDTGLNQNAPLRLNARWAKPKTLSEQVGPQSKRMRYEPDSRVDCWFCLASPNFEAHLVVTLSTDVYVALPKGGLSDTHVLLVPINHVGSQADLSDVGRRDIFNYKQNLASMYFETLEKSGMVVFERFADTRGTYHQHHQVSVCEGDKKK